VENRASVNSQRLTRTNDRRWCY